jgi:hypothetical protein
VDCRRASWPGKSVFGLVIGYSLSRVRHANSQRDLLLFRIYHQGTSFRWERQEGGIFLFSDDVTMATDRTEVEIGWP